MCFRAEVTARVSRKCFGESKYPVRRIGLAPTPCPTVRQLADEFYPDALKIMRWVEKMLKLRPVGLSKESIATIRDLRVHFSLAKSNYRRSTPQKFYFLSGDKSDA